MARSTSEEEIRLRKRARRRLIGAIALTTLVVVTLPMVLDSEPRPIGDDIAVQIPSPDSGPYAPRAPGDAARSGGVPAKSSGTLNAPPLAPADIPALPAPARDPAKAVAPAPAATPSSATPADQKIEMVGALRPPSDPGSAAAAAEARNAEATAAATARANAARAADAKAADAKAADVKASDAKAAGAARAAADTRTATATTANAATASATTGGAEAKSFVIQLGAFAEVSRAKDRHEQLVKAGVKAYTEVIKTPTGDKTRVRAGPFPTRDAAEKANERLKGLGMTDGIVVPRRY